MSGLVTSQKGRRLCFYILFSLLPVTLFAAAAAQASPIAASSGAAFNYFGTAMFALAIIHTFLAAQFMKLAHKFEHKHREQLLRRGDVAEAAEAATARHEVSFKAELFHFLGEIEVVFGLWVLPLMLGMIYFHGWGNTVNHLNSLKFTEPLFVLVIMSIAASRPVLVFAQSVMSLFAGLGSHSVAAWWLSILTLGPLLGSFITEPAAMTISAMLLAKKFYDRFPSKKFAYATLGLLFVNVSIGGTLTHFAAPPVLMVAGTWGWDMPHMFLHFGWKSALAVVISNLLFWLVFRKELARMNLHQPSSAEEKSFRRPVPNSIIAIHIAFLAWTVFTNHHPVLFIGGFLFFIGFTQATAHHQDELSLRGPLLVAFFLAGLVIHGSLQSWWIQPLLAKLGSDALFWGATVLTAFNDNAAITYLASLVPGLTSELKYAVVAGAVTGGGLTVIANAPNPAGVSILGKFFDDSVSPLYLALGALIPTLIAAACFLLFGT
ncbi:MAG TPA: putative Na+/H+ antiporter [Verrucomicrobiae bacterium]